MTESFKVDKYLEVRAKAVLQKSAPTAKRKNIEQKRPFVGAKIT